ncbi:MAG: T9SS type A sorting domain-containing protein [Bacteroidetes bacterium]|nr:MAG: T9SS type A sorting domain-containing protein [Bacteroidota bacterium]
MKKLYLLIIAVGFISVCGFAQERIAKAKTMDVAAIQAISQNQSLVQPMGVIDTLVDHWDRIAPLPSVDSAVTYTSSKGFVAGQNEYGDIAKCQKFDANYGVISGGNINGILLWFGAKVQGAGTAMFTPTIWADNAGVPGTVLGTATPFSISSIDTSVMASKLIFGPQGVQGIYNVSATFTPPLAIPTNQTFWAGMSFTYASGDSAGLYSSRHGNFPDAATHTYEQWSDNSWHSFNDGTNSTWQLDVAIGVYPVVDFASGVNEQNSNMLSLSAMPNPAKDHTLINYELKESSNVEFSMYDVAGKKLSELNQGMQSAGKHSFKLDISEISSGIYSYTISAGDYKMTNKISVVK